MEREKETVEKFGTLTHEGEWVYRWNKKNVATIHMDAATPEDNVIHKLYNMITSMIKEAYGCK